MKLVAGNDSKLIARAQAGDRAAFDDLVRQHYALAYNVAYRMLGDHDLSADAMQVAFVRAYRAIGRFRREAGFSTWLYRIVTNVCLDQLRRNDRTSHSLTVQDEYDGDALEERDLPDGGADPAASVEQRERQKMVQTALMRLHPGHREILAMYDLSGLSYEEISEVLRVPLGTVKSRLNRARHALKDELAEHMELFD